MANSDLDSARYRWLKKQPQSWMLEYMRESRPLGKTLDAAIDAAMGVDALAAPPAQGIGLGGYTLIEHEGEIWAQYGEGHKVWVGPKRTAEMFLK